MLFAFFFCSLLFDVDFDPRQVIINPYAVDSPSGAWRLEVEPGDRFGTGASTNRMLRDGSLEQEISLPFTFQIAAITDDGYALGLCRTDRRSRGDFVFCVLGPDGATIREERWERTPPNFFHVPPNPNVRYLLVDPSGDWVIFGVADSDINRGEEEWWRFSIRSDAPREILHPATSIRLEDRWADRRWILDVEEIPDTPWVLTHWYRYEDSAPSSQIGATYALMDGHGNVGWQLSLADDYADEMHRSVARRRGGILDVLSDRTIAIWHAATGERVEYQIAANPEADPLVVEIGRRKFDWEEKSAKAVEYPIRRLEASQAIALLAGTQGDPTWRTGGDLCDFGFTQSGLPIAIRRDGPGQYVSVFFGDGLETPHEVVWDPIVEPMASGNVEVHTIRAGEWVISAREWGEGGEGAWYIVDATTGKLRLLPGMSGVRVGGVTADIDAAAGMAYEGFVALISFHMGSYTSNSLVECDIDGSVLWKVEEKYEDPTKLFGPADVACLTDGTVAVLETVPNKVKLYSGRGEWLKTIDLEESFGQEPNYPTSIGADPVGGFLVNDFQGDPPLWSLSAVGEVLAKWTPKHSTGHSPARLSSTARPGPDGSLWARDSGAIYRLDDRGVVERTFGSAPDDAALQEPADVDIDTLGRVWILDKRTGARFGFDEAGRPASVARFLPEDGDRGLRERITVRPDGGVLIQHGFDRLAIRFDVKGRRIGPAPDDCGEIYLELPGERFLCGGYTDPLRVVDGDGKPVATFEKMPDGTWSGGGTASVSADGQAALLRGGLVLLDASGRPQRTIPVPDGAMGRSRLSLNGDHALISGYHPDGWLYTFSKDRWERVIVAEREKNKSWALGLSRDGEALLAVDRETYTLRRYPLR